MSENPSSETLTVWLVEDERRYRETMSFVLSNAAGLNCPETFVDVESLFDHLEQASPSALPCVLLLDIHLPGQMGVEALPDLVGRVPNTAIVMLTIAEDDDLIFQSFRSGASGYLIKDEPIEHVIEAVRQAAAGGTLMPAPVAQRVLDEFRTMNENQYELTSREREVLTLMTEGLSQQEIADHLYLSPHTVNTHVQHLYAKLQVTSGIEAVVKAVREGLV